MNTIVVPDVDLSKEELCAWYQALGVNPELAENLAESFNFSYQPRQLHRMGGARLYMIAPFKNHVPELQALQIFLKIMIDEISKVYVHLPEPREGKGKVIAFVDDFIPSRKFIAKLYDLEEPLDLISVAEMSDEEATEFLSEHHMAEFATSFDVLRMALQAIARHNKAYE